MLTPGPGSLHDLATDIVAMKQMGTALKLLGWVSLVGGGLLIVQVVALGAVSGMVGTGTAAFIAGWLTLNVILFVLAHIFASRRPSK